MEIATEVGELYGPLTEEKQAEFVVEAPRGLVVNGDPHLLAQAIGNLVDNAVKYTPYGGTVELRVSPLPGAVIEIAVADNGPGIADVDKPRVTERFYRCRATGDAAGLGLGLSVVDAIARLHEGALALADNDPGLIASLTIPAAPPPTASLAAHPLPGTENSPPWDNSSISTHHIAAATQSRVD